MDLTHGKYLGVDYGDVRTGVAVCDKTEFLASPVCVINESYMPKLIDKLIEVINEKKPEKIVVGLPKNMDGSLGFRAEECTATAEKIKEISGIPTEMWDERCTTVLAHNALNVTNTRGKKRKETVDAVAAVLILESYLDFRKNSK